MLRKRLLARIGLLIGAFVIGAVGAIAAMQVVLNRFDRANSDAASLIQSVQELDNAAASAQLAALVDPNSDGAMRQPELGPCDRQLQRIRAALDQLNDHPMTRPDGRVRDTFERARMAAQPLLTSLGVSSRAGIDTPALLAARVEWQQQLQELEQAVRTEVGASQSRVAREFRVLVFVLTVAAMAMVNIAAIVLLRTAQMILRPVDALVVGSRELAAERFTHRVSVPLSDEFAELAHAYNHLAEQLQVSESRKAEALRQLAVTLNHELNNAASIIEMQLSLLARQPGAHPDQARCLREIRASLGGISQTIASLKEIRRVVLTDYLPGQKMVDLERSIADRLPSDPTPTPL